MRGNEAPVRIAVLSDIHGNLEALEAVLQDAESAGAAALYSLGDIVGYGPCPARCIEIVRSRAAVSLVGNHDAAVAGLTPLEWFNEYARRAVEWTRGCLDAGHVDYLGSLPYTHREPDLVLAHASPVEPERWHYIHGPADVDEPFSAFSESLCFVGHSHRPGIYAVGTRREPERCGTRTKLGKGLRHLVNAGSVGQPRDGDARAAYVLFDEERGTVELRRVPYAVARTQQRMRAAGLPPFLIERLAAGV
jgi:diadenosine tetraphosphatase ApaH/serine/threonine PP2A family protein phosphatase